MRDLNQLTKEERDLIVTALDDHYRVLHKEAMDVARDTKDFNNVTTKDLLKTCDKITRLILMVRAAKVPKIPPGVIVHDYIDASDAPGQYAADQCNRQAVTAKWLWEHPDAQGYMYNQTREEMGMDPWVDITGVDAEVNSESIILEWGRTGTKTVGPLFEVYVSKKAIT